MFKEYISNTIGQLHWVIHTQKSFLIPYLEQIKDTQNNTLITIIRKDQYKVIGEFEAAHSNNSETYIVKVYKYPHLFQKIKSFFKHTKAFNEFKTTYIANMKGIPVEAPVAYGEQKRIFPQKSYLIIRKIKNSNTLKEYFKNTASLEERRDILKKFGKLSKDIHNAGVKQDDFSLDNFLVYNDEISGGKVTLIDFERVSIQTKFLGEKHRVWYLAKLNRAKGYFTNTERLRFLMSYADSDFDYCKRLASQIEATTIYLQKKDAKKFWKQCINENRKFGIFRNNEFYGYYRKNYAIETLTTLLNTIRETTQEVIYINRFQILHFKENSIDGQNYNKNITRAWMHANALFALRINVPVPVGFFGNISSKISKEWFLISEIPENCISLDKYIGSCPDKNPMKFTLSRLAEQVSPFGIFSRGFNPKDVLVQTNEGQRLKCYLGNYNSFCINRLSSQKNKRVNVNIIKQLFQI